MERAIVAIVLTGYQMIHVPQWGIASCFIRYILRFFTRNSLNILSWKSCTIVHRLEEVQIITLWASHVIPSTNDCSGIVMSPTWSEALCSFLSQKRLDWWLRVTWKATGRWMNLYAHFPSSAIRPAPRNTQTSMNANCLLLFVLRGLKRKSRARSSTRPV